ncbi:MAG: hypothetical protein KDK41_17565, partial [Leptospiraceae bacterium]|nr:hypothetical protein [Leptospiraceae bacterium]
MLRKSIASQVSVVEFHNHAASEDNNSSGKYQKFSIMSHYVHSLWNSITVVEFHNAGIIRKVLWKTIAIFPVTEFRNGIVFFVVL